MQSLQGKANFLRRFVLNYVELASGFTQLLKQGTPSIWHEAAQKSFDDLNIVLINAPLLHPPNYHRDYFLYLAASSSTIIMVLVQDDNEGNENVIYYLSRNILNIETHYAQVEKLALVFV